MIGHQLSCSLCSTIIYVCKACYRGQLYCSNPCRQTAVKASKKRRNQKYANSSKGKQAQKKATIRYLNKKEFRPPFPPNTPDGSLVPDDLPAASEEFDELSTQPRTEKTRSHRKTSQSRSESNSIDTPSGHPSTFANRSDGFGNLTKLGSSTFYRKSPICCLCARFIEAFRRTTDSS